jgi:LPS-assembly protein
MTGGTVRLNEVWKKGLLGGVAVLAASSAASAALAQSAAAPVPVPAAPATPGIRGQTLGNFNSQTRSSSDQELVTPRAAPPTPANTTADQLLGADAFYMEADTVVRDDEHHTWTARGGVEARYQGRVLRANEVIFNQSNGVVTARGDAQLLNADGTSEFAQTMTVDRAFRTGIALAFSTRQQKNAKLAADEAVRLNKDAMELNKAVFTVCDICAADGTPQNPTWSIQAERVIQDHKRQIVYYKNVVIKVRGLPVLASPVFWHVDPAAARGSGLLAPRITLDSKRGFSYEQPYLFVLSPSSDLILSPQINTKVNPLLNGEYRKRFYSGEIDARFGYTFDQEFDSHGNKYGDSTSRSYILAQGAFAPTDNWTYGFTAERVTDPLFFQRYNTPNVFGRRGLFTTDDQRLLSQLYAVEQDSRSYLSIAALSFQGLRPTDLNNTFPIVGPLIEGRFEPSASILGGRLRIEGGGVLLDRPRDVTTDKPPGVDSRRATIGGNWRSSYTFYNGIRLEPFVDARGDLYNVDDVSTTDTGMHTTTRGLATAGLDASWPFFRRNGDMTVTLEPIAQFAASPKAVVNKYIPNEDSQVIDFDETNLFDPNHSPGFDYYEGGIRANVGGRATFHWDDGPSAQILIGRSLRTEVDPTLPARTSLNQTESDWVFAASGDINATFSTFTRGLLEAHTGKIRRIEYGMNAATPRASGYIRYMRDEADINGLRTETAQAGGQLLLTQRWGVVASANWDIVNNYPVQQEFGLLYQDECTHWELVYQHDGTINRTLRPSDKIILRLMLATLGATGYQRPDFR